MHLTPVRSRMQMKKNVNNDVSMNPPIAQNRQDIENHKIDDLHEFSNYDSSCD